MPPIQTSVYPGYEKAAEEWNISSAVRVPASSSIIAVGGQTSGINWQFGTLEEQLTIIFEVCPFKVFFRHKSKRAFFDMSSFAQKLDKALQAAVPEMTSEKVWKCVYYINSYHVGWSPEQGQLMAKMTKKYMGDHRAAGTGVGVENLAYIGCLVEIAVYAEVP